MLYFDTRVKYFTLCNSTQQRCRNYWKHTVFKKSCFIGRPIPNNKITVEKKKIQQMSFKTESHWNRCGFEL